MDLSFSFRCRAQFHVHVGVSVSVYADAGRSRDSGVRTIIFGIHFTAGLKPFSSLVVQI